MPHRVDGGIRGVSDMVCTWEALGKFLPLFSANLPKTTTTICGVPSGLCTQAA